MKLHEAIQFQLEPLYEALRASNADLDRVIAANHDDFLIGIEYEFHLNNSQDPDESSGVSYDEAYMRIEEEVESGVDILAGMIANLLMIFDDDMEFSEALIEEDEDKMDRFRQFLLVESRKADDLYRGHDFYRSGLLQEDETIRQFHDMMMLPTGGSGLEIAKEYESIIEGTLEAIDGDNFTSMENRNFQKIMEKLETTDWFSSEMEIIIDRLTPSDDYDSDGNIDFVRTQLPPHILQMTDNIEIDSSVPDGVEVISNPLPFRDAMEYMKFMFDFIDTHGHTSSATGMHVNISARGFAQGILPDPLKVAVLMDIDFFQNYSTKSSLVKYPKRNNMVDELTSDISNPSALALLAAEYNSSGISGLEEMLKHMIVRSSKFKAINWTSFLQDYKPHQRRIEFRYPGGENYEKRFDELERDIKYMIFVISAVTDGNFQPQVYVRSLMRMLDRAAERAGFSSFNDVLVQNRQGRVASRLP